jgi:deoxyribodipyrimidine photo-lyase
MSQKKIIVWFRNDLRLEDHEPLTRALELEKPIIPVYCFDPRFWGTTQHGFPKTGPCRAMFLLESLRDLKQSLQALGNDLFIIKGMPEVLLPLLAKEHGAGAIYCHKEATSDESAIELLLATRLKTMKVRLESFWGSTLYHVEDLPFPARDMPDVFSQFRKLVEDSSAIRMPLPRPTVLPKIKGIAPGPVPSLEDLHLVAPEPDTRAGIQFNGGETEARKRLHKYIWLDEGLKIHRDTRNPFIEGAFSSNFSPWLSNGCLSPRIVQDEIRRYGRERGKIEAAQWFNGEFMWRDFYKFIALKYGNRIFHSSGIKERKQTDEEQDRHLINAYIQSDLFERWRVGNTGFPLVDATMRRLLRTGFITQRGRSIAAGFLTHTLKLDWLRGAEWFESQLIDYDACTNYGNWMYIAGVGNDPREHRHYDVLKQIQMHDPSTEYITSWVPELARIPAPNRHQPYRLSKVEQQELNFHIGVDYPYPIVDQPEINF